MSSDPVALITGRGHFVDDEIPAGTLHASFARSPLAHAIVNGIDTSAPHGGSIIVHTAATLDPPPIPAQMRPTAPAAVGMARPVLATDRVRYVGEPLALALAPRAVDAADGSDSVWAELDPLPEVVDPAASEHSTTLLFPDSESNVVSRSARGRADAPLPDSPVTLDLTIRHTRVAAVPIETLAILAIPRDGRVEIWCGSQQPHRLLRALTAIFGVAEDVFRVRVPDVGGAFGLKGPLYPEYIAVIAAAMTHDRPVLWRERRREAFSGGVHGRGMQHRIRLAGSEDGTIHAARLDILADLGAYPQSGFMVGETAAAIGAGPYRVDDVGVSITAVVTNTAPTGPYRGAGRPEAAMALERAVDEYARRIGIEPVEVRRRNLIDASDLPYHSPTGAIYDSGDYRRALDLAVSAVDLAAIRSRQRAGAGSDADPIGVGFATFVEPAGGPASSGEYGAVDIATDGGITIRTGSTPAGQPHDRTWSRLVAELFDIEPDTISIIAGDTDRVARGEGTFGSRSTQLTGSALVLSAGRLLDRTRELAAAMVEADPRDLRVEEGGFVVAGSPETRITLAEVASFAHDQGEELFEEEFHIPGAQTFPYGTHAAIVTIARETGEVRIERIVAVDDCGTVLDHSGLDGQLRGAIVQGIGQALFEGIAYRPDGQPLTASLMDYAIPRASDVPAIDLDNFVTPAANPLGAKGAGESGIVGVPAAILNAVMDALAPAGVADLDLPLRPGTVWQAMSPSSGDEQAT
jgi:carbon-monoxide dehydrogenase large subunit